MVGGEQAFVMIRANVLSTHLLSARVVSSALQISTFLFIVILGGSTLLFPFYR